MPPAADPPTSPIPAAAAAAVAPTTEKALPEEIIDMETFEQIREMDDEGSDEFSRAIVEGFLEQAKETFDKMDVSIKERDLDELSSLGHFLKGSSATLGVIRLKDYCEKIQHYGDRKDETGNHDACDDETCLNAISEALDGMRHEFSKVDNFFKVVYPEDDS